MVREFDIWSACDGAIAVREVRKIEVCDADAPTGFCTYEGRITANNKSDALNKYTEEHPLYQQAS
ncbi:hypothetical protein P7F88_08855 [Vibrio hannami]|uniref:hypothetical protein n=1 Tax=Vibrio hannami TaxID=2717094 RepID=UPI00240F763A|nr:hypothetical protein [Vibrio hannami]MDG3086206.1 hypothetical protein [Vibrio hannami]